jgi:hypothetical protein
MMYESEIPEDIIELVMFRILGIDESNFIGWTHTKSSTLFWR